MPKREIISDPVTQESERIKRIENAGYDTDEPAVQAHFEEFEFPDVNIADRTRREKKSEAWKDLKTKAVKPSSLSEEEQRARDEDRAVVTQIPLSKAEVKATGMGARIVAEPFYEKANSPSARSLDQQFTEDPEEALGEFYDQAEALRPEFVAKLKTHPRRAQMILDRIAIFLNQIREASSAIADGGAPQEEWAKLKKAGEDLKFKIKAVRGFIRAYDREPTEAEEQKELQNIQQGGGKRERPRGDVGKRRADKGGDLRRKAARAGRGTAGGSGDSEVLEATLQISPERKAAVDEWKWPETAKEAELYFGVLVRYCSDHKILSRRELSEVIAALPRKEKAKDEDPLEVLEKFKRALKNILYRHPIDLDELTKGIEDTKKNQEKRSQRRQEKQIEKEVGEAFGPVYMMTLPEAYAFVAERAKTLDPKELAAWERKGADEKIFQVAYWRYLETHPEASPERDQLARKEAAHLAKLFSNYVKERKKIVEAFSWPTTKVGMEHYYAALQKQKDEVPFKLLQQIGHDFYSRKNKDLDLKQQLEKFTRSFKRALSICPVNLEQLQKDIQEAAAPVKPAVEVFKEAGEGRSEAVELDRNVQLATLDEARILAKKYKITLPASPTIEMQFTIRSYWSIVSHYHIEPKPDNQKKILGLAAEFKKMWRAWAEIYPAQAELWRGFVRLVDKKEKQKELRDYLDKHLTVLRDAVTLPPVQDFLAKQPGRLDRVLVLLTGGVAKPAAKSGEVGKVVQAAVGEKSAEKKDPQAIAQSLKDRVEEVVKLLKQDPVTHREAAERQLMSLKGIIEGPPTDGLSPRQQKDIRHVARRLRHYLESVLQKKPRGATSAPEAKPTAPAAKAEVESAKVDLPKPEPTPAPAQVEVLAPAAPTPEQVLQRKLEQARLESVFADTVKALNGSVTIILAWPRADDVRDYLLGTAKQLERDLKLAAESLKEKNIVGADRILKIVTEKAEHLDGQVGQLTKDLDFIRSDLVRADRSFSTLMNRKYRTRALERSDKVAAIAAAVGNEEHPVSRYFEKKIATVTANTKDFTSRHYAYVNVGVQLTKLIEEMAALLGELDREDEQAEEKTALKRGGLFGKLKSVKDRFTGKRP